MTPKIVVGLLMERTVPFQVFWNHVDILKKWTYFETDYKSITRARNWLVKRFCDSDFTHLLMLDLDHAHPAELPARLVTHAEADPDKLVITGLYFDRAYPHPPSIGRLGYPGENRSCVPYGDYPQGLIKVEFSCTGSMLLSRKLFDLLPPPWFEESWSTDVHGELVPEDVIFCRKCKANGIDIWCDTNLISPHLPNDWFIDGQPWEKIISHNLNRKSNAPQL